MITETSDDNFKSDIAKGLSLTDFSASWCGPCHMEAPVIKKLSDKYADKVSFNSMNVDKNPETPQEFGIMSIPTMIITKNGKMIDSIVGYHSLGQISKVLDKYLKQDK